jgi:hypothetical protein
VYLVRLLLLRTRLFLSSNAPAVEPGRLLAHRLRQHRHARAAQNCVMKCPDLHNVVLQARACSHDSYVPLHAVNAPARPELVDGFSRLCLSAQS